MLGWPPGCMSTCMYVAMYPGPMLYSLHVCGLAHVKVGHILERHHVRELRDSVTAQSRQTCNPAHARLMFSQNEPLLLSNTTRHLQIALAKA